MRSASAPTSAEAEILRAGQQDVTARAAADLLSRRPSLRCGWLLRRVVAHVPLVTAVRPGGGGKGAGKQYLARILHGRSEEDMLVSADRRLSPAVEEPR